MEIEAIIEEKIRERKKAKGKLRGVQNRRMELGQPKRKKMDTRTVGRHGSEEEIEPREDNKAKEIAFTTSFFLHQIRLLLSLLSKSA